MDTREARRIAEALERIADVLEAGLPIVDRHKLDALREQREFEKSRDNLKETGARTWVWP